MTKEEIYNKATAINLGEYPLGTRMDVVYSAMDLFAKDQSIAFALWREKLTPVQRCTVWPPAGSGSSTGLYSRTDEDLYDEFLQQQLLK